MSRYVCKGFQAAGVAAGLKKGGEKDMGMIVSDTPAAVAGVFTRNRIQAAPVLLDRERVRSGVCRTVIVNSKNANCCTGGQGMADAVSMGRGAAEALGIPEEQVCVASTGVIGQPMPMQKILAATPGLASSLRPDGFEDFAAAILTTDLVPKLAVETGDIGGVSFTVLGVAKGSGMIRPDMATMLCFVCTDLEVAPSMLQEMLRTATDRSFNRITVDGDTSTNDTVLLMASGASGASIHGADDQAAFQAVLDRVMESLARMVAKDGEGATKLVDIRVTGAATEADARAVADTIAHSSLVKTALFGEDANWGRIIAAAGRAGVPVDPDRIDIAFNEVWMARSGMGCGAEAEARATEVLKTPEFTITVNLNMGEETATVVTCDFSCDYVRINADYRT